MWPRRSWVRSLKYLAKRVLRLTASPHAIAAGIAAGVFASFTPYLGLHFMIAFAVAYVIAGNFIAAAAGTFFGNPISFPFIWAATYSTGNFLLTGSTDDGGHEAGMEKLAESNFLEMGFDGILSLAKSVWEPLLKPMTVGAIPLGILFGVFFYMATRWAAITFQIARRKRLSQRAREIKERAMSSIENAKSAANNRFG